MTDITIVTEKACLLADTGIRYNASAIEEDNLLMRNFIESGLTCNRVAWEDVEYDWSSTKIALIKTPWNYFRHVSQFKDWVRSVSRKCVLINDKSIILWNMDKHYLLDLKEKEIAIPDTFVLDSQNGFNPDYWDSILGNHGIVVKPFVSGGAKDTFLLRKPWIESDIHAVEKAIAEQPMMVQPYIQSITTKGEISLVFINGDFTHAMVKIPKPKDFRVQIYHGGKLEEFFPSREEIDFGIHVLQACEDLLQRKLLYARVDICYGEKEELLLMELEAIEPELWYSYSPKAVTALVQSLQKIVHSS